MINFTEKVNLTNYTFIIPSVCVGNVGQLTTDILISTLSMRKVGTLWDPSIIPIIGPSAFTHDIGITTASDLYISEEFKLIILQLRSPIVAALMGALFDKLTDFMLKEKVEKLLIVTGGFAHERHTIEGSPIEHMTNSSFEEKFSKLKDESANWIKYNGEVIHGGGFANRIFKFATQKNIPTLILLKYVSEGDNIPDAIHLMSHLNKLINAVRTNDKGQLDLIPPVSWKLLYGNAPPENIY